MGWSEPTDPTGTYDPAYMTNLYGASWDVAWNTSIYGRPMATGANVLSNCVGYAQGRMLRIWMEDYNPTYNPAQTQTHPFISYNAEVIDRMKKNMAKNNNDKAMEKLYKLTKKILSK